MARPPAIEDRGRMFVPLAAAVVVAAACPSGAPAATTCHRIAVEPGVELFVAKLPARGGPVAPDPVVFLQGGPGEGGTADLESLSRSPLRARRDLYVLDQRGTGLSRPALRCPEFDRAAPRFFARARRDAAAELRSARRAARACATRLRGDGIDLDRFTTNATADDVEAVRLALDLPAVNLFAVSYGTRVAQEVLRRHAASVRTAVLDSGSPTDEAEVRATNLVGDIRAGFARLDRAVPGDLRAQLDRATRRLDQRPVVAQTRGGRVRVTGRDVLAALWNALKDQRLIPQVPLAIRALAAGDRRPIDQLVVPVLDAATQPGGTFLGAQLSVDCADNGAQITRADRRLAARPGRYGTFLLFASDALCDAWGVRPVDAAFATPVRSHVPALLLAGSFDPISLPRQTRAVGRGLSGATYLEIPAGGHVVTGTSACARRLAASFVATGGTADRACLRRERPPRFARP